MTAEKVSLTGAAKLLLVGNFTFLGQLPKRWALYGKLVLIGQTAVGHVLHWSDWRRRRQAQAKASHYRQRLKYTDVHEFG